MKRLFTIADELDTRKSPKKWQKITSLLVITCFLVILIPIHTSTFTLTPQWDVRTGGSDTNGGAFDPTVASPGTDESQGNTGTSESCVVQTTTTNMICTPAVSATTHGPGNYINFTSGVNCTLARFKIVSQSGGTATLSGSTGTAASICLGTLGGSMQTIQAADTASTAEDVVNVQVGTYTWTANFNMKSGSIVGYQTTHGDLTGPDCIVACPIIVTSTALGGPPILGTGTSAGTFLVQSIEIHDANGSNSCFEGGGAAVINILDFINGRMTGCATGVVTAFSGTNFIFIVGSEMDHMSEAVDTNALAGANASYNYFHDNAIDILQGSGSQQEPFVGEYNVFANSTNTSADTILIGYTAIWDHNTYYNCAGNCLDLVMNGGPPASWAQITNNIFYTSAAGAIEHQPQNDVGTNVAMFNNAFGNLGTPVPAVYTNPTNITLTVCPFMSCTGTLNFALNNTAGGGALLQGTGYPSSYGASTTTGTDVGAVQRAGGVTVTVTGNFGSSN